MSWGYIWHRGIPVAWMTRNVLEKAESYNEAIDIITTTNILHGAYLIVSGVNENEGTVITKDRYEVIK